MVLKIQCHGCLKRPASVEILVNTVEEVISRDKNQDPKAAVSARTSACRSCSDCEGMTIVDTGIQMDLQTQIIWLFILAVPIASISWTVTHEEVLRETRERFVVLSRKGKTLLIRKFFYLFTCEYCFSHYITILVLIITNYRLLLDDWRGYLIAGFSLVWIANIYMSLYAFIRIDIKKERIKAKSEEEKLNAG